MVSGGRAGHVGAGFKPAPTSGFCEGSEHLTSFPSCAWERLLGQAELGIHFHSQVQLGNERKHELEIYWEVEG
jgi:hypothetical protein